MERLEEGREGGGTWPGTEGWAKLVKKGKGGKELHAKLKSQMMTGSGSQIIGIAKCIRRLSSPLSLSTTTAGTFS